MDGITPMERACRALAQLQGRDPDEPVLLSGDRKLWQEFEPQVRAVLEAIRVPSGAMLTPRVFSQFTYDADGIDNEYLDCDQMGECWSSMIDALLEEG